MLLRITGMLLFSIALFTVPASARTLNKASNKAPEFSDSLRQPGGHAEFTEMSARRRHHAKRHHAKRHHARRHHAGRRHQYRQSRAGFVRRMGPVFVAGIPDRHGVPGVAGRSVAAHSFASAAASRSGARPDFGGTGLVAEARRHIGTNPTGRSSLWCGHFMNLVLERSGRRGSGSNMARSFASYGQRVSGPQVGAIAVMSRGRRGGHVGVVSGIDANGNPIIISGNHNRRVAESTYPRGRIYAYVMP